MPFSAVCLWISLHLWAREELSTTCEQRRESRGLVSSSCSTIGSHYQEVDLCNMTDHLRDIREGQRSRKTSQGNTCASSLTLIGSINDHICKYMISILWPTFYFIFIIISKYILIFRERTDGDRDKQWLVPFSDIFTGWFLHVPWQGINLQLWEIGKML